MRSPAGDYQGPLKAVIFDWAGTVVDYGSRAPVLAMVELFRRHGIPITPEQARRPMGLHKRDHIAELLRQLEIDADLEALYTEFVPIQIDMLSQHSDLIPGVLGTVAELRRRGMKIGATTGYTTEMMQVLEPAARRQGFWPDASVAADQVPAGRPAPWMCLQVAMQLGVYPMAACVKVGDTPADIAEGLNAGMWTVGVTRTGNEVGLSLQEITGLPAETLAEVLSGAAERLTSAGAHGVIESVADLPAVVEQFRRAGL